MSRSNKPGLALAFSMAIATALPASASSYKTLYSFAGGNDAAYIDSNIISYNGMLYGVSYYGGKNDEGTLFAVNPATGTESVLLAFGGSEFGANPASLTEFGGRLYGTAQNGGANNWGTIYWLNPTNGHSKVLYACKGHRDCGAPNILTNVGGTLFGSSNTGGIDTTPGTRGGDGTIFAINPTTGAERVVSYFWRGNDKGLNPRANVIFLENRLWGTAWTGGGSSSGGTVYAVNPANGSMRLVYGLGANSSNGANLSNPVVYLNGLFYTTADYGGAGNAGTVFSVDPKTGAATTVYAFKGGSDASTPNAVIVFGGKLLGTSYYGGKYGGGTIFSLDPSTGTETVLHSFGGSGDGAHPICGTGMIALGGTLYGTTSEGGKSGVGTVFSFTP